MILRKTVIVVWLPEKLTINSIDLSFKGVKNEQKQSISKIKETIYSSRFITMNDAGVHLMKNYNKIMMNDASISFNTD